jgi:flagellar motor protein MotB
MLPHPIARSLRLAPMLILLLGTGCASKPLFRSKENAALKRSVADLQRQNADLKRQSQQLDADNQQLQRMMAEQQYQQPMQTDVAAQPEVPYDQLALDAQTPGYQAPGYEAPGYDYANNPAGAAPPVVASSPTGSSAWLPMADIPGADVVREGEVVRVRLTNSDLFAPGQAKLRPGAKRNLERVARAIRDSYPGYLVGIEGHTDADPIKKSNWKNNHQLSVERAMAVYDYLRKEGGLSTSQLFVAGFGPNRPIASNTSRSGKAKNRRVELAILPDQLGQAY